MREIPKPGQIYRHFKGNLYQIVTIARHSETLEALVIYQALYGEFQVYARPLHMFMSEVDHEKYSDVRQRERFELVRTANEIAADEMYVPQETTEEVTVQGVSEEAPKDIVKEISKKSGINSDIEEFLDADTYAYKYRIFTGMQHRITDDMINVLAMSLDTEVPEGELETRIKSLKNFLSMQVKYECDR